MTRSLLVAAMMMPGAAAYCGVLQRILTPQKVPFDEAPFVEELFTNEPAVYEKESYIVTTTEEDMVEIEMGKHNNTAVI